jgi:hypothetical protein
VEAHEVVLKPFTEGILGMQMSMKANVKSTQYSLISYAKG